MISSSRLALLGCVLICLSVPAAEDAPTYAEHQDLSYYLDNAGQKQPVETKEDWQVRRGHILANLHKVMGDLPRPVPLEMKVLEETNVGELVRKKISYHTDSTERVVTAYLFLPPGEGKLPAVLCLHQTIGIGKGEPAGLGEIQICITPCTWPNEATSRSRRIIHHSAITNTTSTPSLATRAGR